MFKSEENFTSQSCWLRYAVTIPEMKPLMYLPRSHANEVALNILHPLDPGLILPGGTLSVKELSIQHCRDEVELADHFLKRFPADGLIGRGQFIVLSTLVPFLTDVRTHGCFTAGCQILRFGTTTLPVMKMFLQGIGALARSLKQVIPTSARQYFEGLVQDYDVKDLPTSFVLPQLRDMQELVVNEQHSVTQTREETSPDGLP
jgi:hypothetical protein